MLIKSSPRSQRILACLGGALLSACGGGGNDGPAIEANPQSISFATAPTLMQGGQATVVATATSGLPVRYRSATPTVCTVDENSGIVIDLAAGTCTIAANQAGNSHYAQAAEVTQSLPVVFSPDQRINLTSSGSLSLGGTVIVSASATSGLPVALSSLTPALCAIAPSSGVVTGLATGECIIAANQAGDTNYHAAAQVTLALTIKAPTGLTVPGAPTAVTAAPGSAANTVVVSFGATESGGSPITAYTVASQPAGITADGSGSPITVSCPGSCRGFTFTVAARNSIGTGSPSAAVPITATYQVVETFYEPDTQPNNSIFVGSFTYNFTTGTVTDLKGILSESMTGGATPYPNDTMKWIALNNQLVSWHDSSLGGTFAATFRNSDTNTFLSAPGADAWSPKAGVTAGGLYYGSPGTNPGNAYALIFVPDDPATPLTAPQISKLAYADCAPGGMMGDTCMTGTAFSSYGSDGTMGGIPQSQTITRK